jgi:subtilisin family serine protease
MAGIIAAAENNGFGIVGLAPGVDLVAVPVCKAGAAGGDECPLYDLLRGMDAAWQAEAQILNVSLVGPPNALLERAMARLDELGVVVVAAAGNEDTDEPRYPAAYPTVLGVGAVDRDGRSFPRASHGASADLEAPGVEILSTLPGDAFAFGDGTSLAAAHVSGVLALVTAAGGDPLAARTALFRAAEAARDKTGAGLAALPPVCEALALLGRSCP